MRCCTYLAEFLARVGVRRAYSLSGGMIAPMLDAIGEHPALALVNVAHEQAGGFCADAEARITGVPGVALGTSGPGALNLVTCIAGSYFDSVPMLFVTGQVQSYLRRARRPLRQFALQECDLPDVVRPVCKAVVTPSSAAAFPDALSECFVQAMSGRPGPVVLDVPLDIQMGECGTDAVTIPDIPPPDAPGEDALREAAEVLASARRPVLLVGGGIRTARDACRSFANRFRLPLAATISALDVMPADDPLRIGMPGTYGTRAANTTLAACDAVLVLGSRLDQGVLGADPAGFGRRRNIVQVDIDPGESRGRLARHLAIDADCRAVLRALTPILADRSFTVPAEWLDEVRGIASRFPDTGERAPTAAIDPNGFFSRFGDLSGAAATFCVDAGQHTWFCAQSLRLRSGQRLVSSTGLWAMGTAIPAAIGAGLATGRPAVAIVGDGAVQLNIQDLATAVQARVALKVVVIDNGAHGMVRQFQSEFLEGRHHATLWGYHVPDLVRIFAAYGLDARTVADPSEIDDALAWLWSDPMRPLMLRVITDAAINVAPSVPFGRQLQHMRPAHAGSR